MADILWEMANRERLFIYGHKEVLALILIASFVVAFAFTLGVHFGKRVGAKSLEKHPEMKNPVVETVSDRNPPLQEIQEQSKGASQVADENLNQVLYDEVARVGMKLETRRQVELPKETPDEKIAHPLDKPSSKMDSESILNTEAARRQPPSGKFTLQVGSSSSTQAILDQVESLESLGMKPYLRLSNSAGKEKLFQVYLGGFASQQDAETAGEKYRNQHVIDSYVATQISQRE